MKYDRAMRLELADEGWLDPARTASREPISATELSCPGCDDGGHVVVYENDAFTTIVSCSFCDAETEIADRDIL
jgi:hypothetical protein